MPTVGRPPSAMPIGQPSYAPGPPGPSPATGAMPGTLALAFQESLTVTVRLRAGAHQDTDAETLRRHVTQLLAAGEHEARAAGYRGADVKLALFAVVAFLDETVLNSGRPMFADWPRRPLQDELFGGNVGGETFFEYLRQLHERDDAPELADLLEVFLLCLLLGFQGRYGLRDGGELELLVQRTGDRIARIRGARGELSPAWRPPADALPTAASDPWVRRLAAIAAALALLVAGLVVLYGLTLDADVDALRRIAQP